MAPAIYTNPDKWLGILGSAGLSVQMDDVAFAYDRSVRGAAKIKALTSFLKHGETNDIPGVLQDISKLLAARMNMPKNVREGFLWLRKLLKKADKIAVIGEA